VPRAPRANPGVLAAVDLGSNSFHLVVARYTHGQLVVIDRLRESVRLGAGVDDDGRLDREVAARALACLERFGQRLRDMHARDVRVAGTSALRTARGKQSFLERARVALGHPIEIISGMEEARLIYSGVAHTLGADTVRRLVVDIGGGSTEAIIGEGFKPLELASLHVGCVRLSQKVFGDGRISEKRMRRARLATQVELEPVRGGFVRRGWDKSFGSSGTLRAIGECLKEMDPAATSITTDGLAELQSLLEGAGHIRDIKLAAIDDERRAVFPGGVAILAEIFAAFDINEMRVADGALRDGLLHDMVGRLTDEDPREMTVGSMQQRYHVDLKQAERVEQTTLSFLSQVQDTWELNDPLAELSIQWAARLHEIGLDVAHSGYHRHGAYLLENADMPGFAREEQQLLAAIVGGHRRKLLPGSAEVLMAPWDRLAVYLVVLLRLAVLLHRGRSATALPAITVVARPHTIELTFPARWLKEHPLSVEDLQQEVELLRPTGMRLRVYSGTRSGTA
jgi:exopolyphosphatase / guanosine-5'-triphosphate,3'-diphosphate pyrophosphatase